MSKNSAQTKKRKNSTNILSNTRKRRKTVPTITILISGHGLVLNDAIDEDVRENTYNFNPMPIATCVIIEFMEKSDILSIKKLSELYESLRRREGDTRLSHSKILELFCTEFTHFYKEQLHQRILKNRKRFNYFIKKYLYPPSSSQSGSFSAEKPKTENDEYYIAALKSLFDNGLIEEKDEKEYDDLIDYYNIEIGLTSEKHASKMRCKFQNQKRDKTLNLEQYVKYKTYTGITIIDNTNPEFIEDFTDTYTFKLSKKIKFPKNITRSHKTASNQIYKKIMHRLIPSEHGEIERDIIKYSELVNFLKQLGYEKIYVYDMTCNAEEERNVESAPSIMSSSFIESDSNHL